MKSPKQKYEEAVERNLFNAQRSKKERFWTRTILGIKKNDDTYDAQIKELNAKEKVKVKA